MRLIDDKGGYNYRYNVTNEEINRVMHYRFDEDSDNIFYNN